MKGLSSSSVLHKSMELDGMDLRAEGARLSLTGCLLSFLVDCGKPNAQNAVK